MKEYKKITWPSFKKASKLALIAVLVSLAVGAFSLAIDTGMAELIKLMV